MSQDRSAVQNAARWRVRPMTPLDIDRVHEIECDVYPYPWSRSNFVDSLAAGHDVSVFETTSAIIGYTILMWLPDEAHLLNIAVARVHQGEGLGKELLEWACSRARARECRSLLLEVRPSNPKARALYAGAGFAQIGVRKRYYPAGPGGREDALVLVRSLADAPGASTEDSR